MLKFKSIALPKPSEGLSFLGVKELVVPDQSMSLEYILKRFTRGEPLPVGQNVQYGSEMESDFLDVDLEKLAASDLVDKAEYVEKLQEVKAAYEKQQKARADKAKAETEAKAKAAEEKRIRIAARRMAKESKEKLA